MTWYQRRFGLLLGMGKQCPKQRHKKMLLALLLLALAIIAGRNAKATVEETATQTMAEQIEELRLDRENLLAMMNGERAYIDTDTGWEEISVRVRVQKVERVKGI